MPREEPWDARLIASMSRGSQTAIVKRSPRGILFSGACGIVSGAITSALFRGEWWYWAAVIVLFAAIRAGGWMRSRKRHTQPSQ